MKIEEEWRQIKGYENYMVSSLGNVKSLGKTKKKNQWTNKETILKPGKSKGYLRVVLCKDGKTKSFSVHRLVAEAFLSNPYNLPCVNHKDENKLNNCLNNLEFCSYQYNNNYGTCKQRAHEKKLNDPNQSISIKCLDLETNQEIIYPSINEAKRRMKISNINYSLYKSKKPYKNRYIFSVINK